LKGPDHWACAFSAATRLDTEMIVAAMIWISVYLGVHGLLGIRLWNY
jgi:hypothetical protein